jgi:hypothetical protein
VCEEEGGQETGDQEGEVAMFRRYLPFLVALCAFAAWSSPASALNAAPGTGWAVAASVYPTNLPPGGKGDIQIDLVNTGAAPSEGPITVTDTLPPGVIATKAGGMEPAPAVVILSSEEEEENEKFNHGARWHCTVAAAVICTSNPEFLPHVPDFFYSNGLTNEEPAVERIGIAVEVSGNTSGTNHVTVSGGGASLASSTSDPVAVSTAQPALGFAGWDVWLTNRDGTPDTQAGSHPYEMTIFFGLNEMANEVAGTRHAGGSIRNLEVDLPTGFFGEPGAVPQCTRSELDREECPHQSQIGIDSVGTTFEGGGPDAFGVANLGVYNMVPPPGVPAEFAFSFIGHHVFLDAGVRSGGGYGLVEHIDNVPDSPQFAENILRLWGVPAEASHDPERTELGYCPVGGGTEAECVSGVLPKPLLTLPTSCAGPQTFTIRALGTWQDPTATAESSVRTHDSSGAEAGFTGCEQLQVEPSLSAVPDTAFADTPAGLTVDLKVPQETLSLPKTLVASTLKNETVTLPQGVVINPGQAAGLVACQAAEANVSGEGPAACPGASKVGTVKIKTPLLEDTLESELEGNVYVLQSNPPNLQLLVTASADGVYLKLVGNVHLDESTGQITATFTETPELPFTDLKLSFSGGAQAALATPTGCGTYTTTSDLTPWTTPFGGDVLGTSSFRITAGTGGSACASPLPFSPAMIAGATTDQAGGFTSFSLLLQTGDDQQRIEKLQFKEPAGMTGLLSQVPLCPEPQAAQGTCSSASQIGHTVVASGPGPYPLVIPEPGQPPAPIYLTGPYEGAPYGLSIKTPVIAGPFDLGTIITRARIEVDPHTAQLTITTDALPQIIDGVPTDLRSINAVIDRPGFLLNPTNCNPQEFSGTATSAQGAVAPISSHFQVGSCQSLKFTPKLTVSTNAQSSKALGSGLTATVSEPAGALGTQANLTKVKVDLPIQLPSQLKTLQKACLASAFEANPASCPAESIVGHAKVITPLLPVPLTGPAYFVSHGGEAFPSLTIVLQGYGVTVDLVGSTFIKNGVTSTTFKTVPDVPFNTFELTLPQGKYAALAANLPAKAKGSFCGQNLKMPTLFVAQNGLEIHQSTQVAVTGCKAQSRAQKLASALRACRKKPKGRAAACVKQARRKYGPLK